MQDYKHSTQVQKEIGPIPRRFRAHMRGEESPKATQTNSTLRSTIMGQIQEIEGGNPTKLTQGGPPRVRPPLAACLEPNLV
jgi:hypothetical protein